MEKVTIEVCPDPWSETNTAWHLLTAKGIGLGSWHGAKWFPKSLSSFDSEAGTVTIPKWLYDRLFN